MKKTLVNLEYFILIQRLFKTLKKRKCKDFKFDKVLT